MGSSGMSIRALPALSVESHALLSSVEISIIAEGTAAASIAAAFHPARPTITALASSGDSSVPRCRVMTLASPATPERSGRPPSSTHDRSRGFSPWKELWTAGRPGTSSLGKKLPNSFSPASLPLDASGHSPVSGAGHPTEKGELGGEGSVPSLGWWNALQPLRRSPASLLRALPGRSRKRHR